MGRLVDLFFAIIAAGIPAQQFELPKSCGKFPKHIPYAVWLQVDDNGRILWPVEKNRELVLAPVDAKDLGPGLKRQKAVAEKTANFVIGFAGIDKNGARKKYLAEILKRSGLAFSSEECNPPVP